MMKAKSMIALIVILILVSVAAGYVSSLHVYKEFEEKTAYLERHAHDRFEKLEKELKELYVTLEDKVDENKIEMKDVLSKIEVIREDIQGWKRGYKATVSRLSGKIEDLKVNRLTRMVEKLQDEINNLKMTMQDLEYKEELKGVDLGRISVEKKANPEKQR